MINEDVLKINPADILGKDTEYKVVANLPYYITSAVIRHFLEASVKPTMMVLMVQKEVAQTDYRPTGRDEPAQCQCPIVRQTDDCQ